MSRERRVGKKSKKKRKRKRKSKAVSQVKSSAASAASPNATYPEETRAAELVTVGWSLCMLMTTAALIAAAAWWFIERSSPPAEDSQAAAHVGSTLLLFIAAFTGTFCLMLTWPTQRLRITKPPYQVTIFAVVASLLPIITLAIVLAAR